MAKKYDFSGWATVNDVKCSDGRTIRKNAFKDCDGAVVPLVWNHQHGDVGNVLGHALLKNTSRGVRCYGTFNNTEAGLTAKSLVDHGDIKSLSIYANQLKQNGGDVLHGMIREVSLVLAGANKEAFIDTVGFAHGDDGSFDEAYIFMGDDNAEFVLEHSDSSNEEEDMADKNEKTIGEIFDTLNDEQQEAVYAMIGMALEDADNDEEEEEYDDDEEEEYDDDEEEYDDVEHADYYDDDYYYDEEDDAMKHNVFDADERQGGAFLSHSDMETIFSDAKRLGSLKDAVEENLESGVLAHAVYNHNADGSQGSQQTYGIADIDWLFPEARTLGNMPPEFIKREMGWVDEVMNGTHHSPFSRVKSIFANITMDEARARGYLKGHLKKEEVFSLLKRSTDPQTIYKKQKLDRDDVIDITDFDVVSWIKGEMRMMLNEEIARAILVGDGRLVSDDDHISEEHVRPIWKEAELYAVQVPVVKNPDPSKQAKNFIDSAIRARKNYKGTGDPTLFTTEDMLTEMLLIEDTIGHKLYSSPAALATTLRVKKIVTVPVMENLTRTVSGVERTLAGIIVNLADYNVGADKGGAVSMFDDFDIDYNQMKYLIETRISGALVKPYSALILELIPQAEQPSGNGQS